VPGQDGDRGPAGDRDRGRARRCDRARARHVDIVYIGPDSDADVCAVNEREGTERGGSIILHRLSGRAVPGVAIGLLIVGWALLPGVPPGPSTALARVPAVGPGAQCASATEAEAWHGRYGASHVAVEHQYYCGPAHPYNAEWYAAHVGPHPEWYAVYEGEPTTCATYHFADENRWYCYTGP
jgi:hypothetical protein